MIFKLKKHNLIFWLIFAIGFALIFSLTITFDYKVSSLLDENDIYHKTLIFNKIFHLYGNFIMSVPIFISIMCISKIWLTQQRIKKSFQITVILFYNLIYLSSVIMLTARKAWFSMQIKDYLDELIIAIVIYLIAITILVVTNLTLFTKKIWKKEFNLPILLQNSLYCLVFIGLSSLTVVVLKEVFGRPRPIQVFWENYNFKYAFEINFTSSRGVSFPSGHTTSALSLFGLMFYVKPLTLKWKKIFIIIKILIGVLAITTALSRILYLRHFLSDIVFSLLFTSLYFIFTKPIVSRIFYRVPKPKKEKVYN